MRNRKRVCPNLSESLQANTVRNKTKMKSQALQAMTRIHVFSYRNSWNHMRAVGEDMQHYCSDGALAQASWHLWFFLQENRPRVTHDTKFLTTFTRTVCLVWPRQSFFSHWKSREWQYLVNNEVSTNLQKWRSKPSHLSLHFRQGAPAPISWPRVICQHDTNNWIVYGAFT